MTDIISGTPEAQAPAMIAQPRMSGPGALRGQVSLTLNTRFALSLFNGGVRVDKLGPAPGVYRFANYLEQIGIGAAADDPYADWTMMQIERMMDSCEEQLGTWDAEMRAKLCSVAGMDIEVASSVDPHVVTLQLHSPYAHWAARLIGKYDALIAAMLTGHFTGLFDARSVSDTIKAGRRAVRRPFHVANVYRFSGVTRADIEQKTGRALEVIEARGEVPADILNRTEQPRFKFHVKTH